MAVAVELGVDAARAHAHDLDAGALVGGLEAFGVAALAPLGGAVHGFVGVAARGGGAHDVGDLQVALAIRLQRLDAEQDHPLQSLQALVHVGGLVCGRHLERRLAGVVDQQVDVPDRRGLGHRRLDERLIRDVAGQRPIAVGAERLGELLLFCGVKIHAAHEPSPFDQLPRELIPQSQRAARHDCDPLVHHDLPVLPEPIALHCIEPVRLRHRFRAGCGRVPTAAPHHPLTHRTHRTGNTHPITPSEPTPSTLAT